MSKPDILVESELRYMQDNGVNPWTVDKMRNLRNKNFPLIEDKPLNQAKSDIEGILDYLDTSGLPTQVYAVASSFASSILLDIRREVRNRHLPEEMGHFRILPDESDEPLVTRYPGHIYLDSDSGRDHW